MADVKVDAAGRAPRLERAAPTRSRCAGPRWTPARTADAIFALNRPRNWHEFRAAAALFEVPAQNIVYADVDGNIGYQAPGRIPVRGKGDGTLAGAGLGPAVRLDAATSRSTSCPRVYNPPQGYIVTANQAVIDPGLPAPAHQGLVVRLPQPAHHELIEDELQQGKVDADDDARGCRSTTATASRRRWCRT